MDGLARGGIPVYAKTPWHVYATTGVLLLAVLVLLWVLGNYIRLTGRWRTVYSAIVAPLVASPVSWIMVWRRRFAVEERAVACGFALCLRCGYFLEGLPTKHRCPECGLPYDLNVTKAIWREWTHR